MQSIVRRTRMWIAVFIGVIGVCTIAPAGRRAEAQGLELADPASVGLSAERLERLSRFLSADVAEGRIPGAVMLVARHGKIAYLRTFGKRDPGSGTPMPEDGLFRLGSMTKPISIVAALSLIEEGRFRFSTPITQFLPQFAHMQVGTEKTNAKGEVELELAPANRPILVIDLLRHTAGLTYETANDTKIKHLYREAGIGAPGETAAERVDKLAKMPLAYQPGTVWEYGRGIDVLGRICELVSGMRLSQFLQERVLDPLQMRDTAYWVPPEKRERLAGFAPSRSGRERQLRDLSQPPQGEAAGTGLVSTARDYARLLQMLANGGELGGARVLSRKTVELMTTEQLEHDVRTGGPSYYPGPGYGYGLGFAIRRTLGVASELGSVGDYLIEGIDNTFAFVDPKEQLVAVLMVQAFDWLYYRPMIMDLVEQSIID